MKGILHESVGFFLCICTRTSTVSARRSDAVLYCYNITFFGRIPNFLWVNFYLFLFAYVGFFVILKQYINSRSVLSPVSTVCLSERKINLQMSIFFLTFV